MLDATLEVLDLYLSQKQRCRCVFGLAPCFGLGHSGSVYIHIDLDFHYREKSLLVLFAACIYESVFISSA